MDKHPNPADRRKSCQWAASLLAERHRVVVLDTETTGLKGNDEIVQICIRDLDGNDLCSTLVAMTKRKSIPRQASDIHGIKKADLEGKPNYATLSPMLQRVLSGKRIIAYNAEFDLRMMQQVYALGGGYEPDPKQWECAMLAYAAFVGEWNDYHNNYKWQKLGGSHDARDDVAKTIQLIEGMAGFLAKEKKIEAWRKQCSEKRAERDRVASQIQKAQRSIKGTESRFKVYEALDATGIPPGVFFFVGGLILSLVSLLGFGSVGFATLLFLVSCGVGITFFVLGTRDKEADVADAKEKKEALERVLAQKEQELAILNEQKPL